MKTPLEVMEMIKGIQREKDITKDNYLKLVLQMEIDLLLKVMDIKTIDEFNLADYYPVEESNNSEKDEMFIHDRF